MTTGDDFIQLAEQLLGGKDPKPVELRTAISRAYYGAYHLAHHFLCTFSFDPGSKHNLDHYLCNAGNHDADQAGRLLKELQTHRVQADYKLDRRDIESIKNGQLAVLRARKIRLHLDQCRAEPAYSAIGAAIKTYREKTKR